MAEPRQQSATPHPGPSPNHAGIPPLRRPVLRPLLTRLILLTAIWWMLTGGGADAWGLGIVVILASLIISLRLLPAGPRHVSLRGLIAFAGFFFVRSVIAGTQVALIAIRPRLDIRPVMMEIPTRLKDESERVFLASTLSLLPGSLNVGLEGSTLRLHVLDERMPVEEEVRAVEYKVARIFCGELE